MTSNSSVSGQGGCPAPFLEAQLFSSTGGCMLSALSLSEIAADRILVIDGRFCSPVGSISCCLPCPQTEWLYPDNFDTVTHSANWLNVASMVCSAFLLLSFAFLPVSKTHRHYLSICLTQVLSKSLIDCSWDSLSHLVRNLINASMLSLPTT
jgi:hypothetical protein